jgi:hypothetical protein
VLSSILIRLSHNFSPFSKALNIVEQKSQDEAYNWIMNADAVSASTVTDDDEDIDDILSIKSDQISPDKDINLEYYSDDHSDRTDQ